VCVKVQVSKTKDRWIGLCSVLRPHQHSIGYTGDGFYRSKDPTNSIKVLKENLQKKITQRTKKTQNTHAYSQNGKTNTAYNYNTASPVVYNNMGWLGDSSHRGQGCQAERRRSCRRGTPTTKDRATCRYANAWVCDGTSTHMQRYRYTHLKTNNSLCIFYSKPQKVVNVINFS